MVPQRVLLLMIQIVGDTSCKNVWDKKYKLMHLENNLKDLFLKLQAVMTAMVLL
jgi:hypothetical protein